MSFTSNIYKFIQRKLIPKSLLSRFLLIIIIPTLIGQFLALHLFYERHWYNVLSHNSSLIITEVNALIKENNFEQSINKNKNYLNLSYIFLKNHKITENKAEKNNPEELAIFKKALTEKLKHPNLLSVDKLGKIYLSIEINDGVLVITLPSKILINPSTYIFVLWVIFLTLLLLSVSLIFSKNQIKSILELTNAAEKYGRGESMYNYKPSGAKEIRLAGLAFIKMKHRIERQTARRTQMLAMISHDLRTPLTRMKLQVELMEDSEEKDELSHDIVSMEHMIASYLDFAKGEGGENFIKIELTNWLQAYIKSSWSKYNIELNFKKKNIFIQIKPHAFKRALDNIIGNAIKYGTIIKISVYKYGSDTVITIEDNGKGIDDSEKTLVFRPFYRSDKARTLENSNNVGLGLAITKEIIIGHYGNITLEKSANLNGLLVKIKLPRIN